jgi:hypothetical protein
LISSRKSESPWRTPMPKGSTLNISPTILKFGLSFKNPCSTLRLPVNASARPCASASQAAV